MGQSRPSNSAPTWPFVGCCSNKRQTQTQSVCPKSANNRLVRAGYNYVETSGSNLTFESRMGLPSDLPNVVVGFQAAISRFVAEANDDPKPFTWLADPNKSIVAVRRGYQVLDSIH
jgi:hypothetical protein